MELDTIITGSENCAAILSSDFKIVLPTIDSVFYIKSDQLDKTE